MRLRLNAPSRHVLVVDDDQDVGDSLVMLLQCFGMNARSAYSGWEALDLLAEFKPDLAFLDISMPGMDGCEAARRIRSLPEGKNIVLVALTAWGSSDMRRRTAEAGFDHHFVKPMEIDALEGFIASFDQDVPKGAASATLSPLRPQI